MRFFCKQLVIIRSFIITFLINATSKQPPTVERLFLFLQNFSKKFRFLDVFLYHTEAISCFPCDMNPNYGIMNKNNLGISVFSRRIGRLEMNNFFGTRINQVHTNVALMLVHLDIDLKT